VEGDDVVIAAAYDYEAPSTLKEAQKLAAEDGAVLLAGGQSLLTELKRGALRPRLVVDLRRIESLRETGKNGWGAMVTLDELAGGAPSALTDAIASIRDPQVRNRATIGGSVSLVQQGADLPAVALALGAELTKAAEIVTAVRMPAAAPGSGSAYEKLANPGSGYAICGVAAAVTVAADGAIVQAAVALAGARPTAVSLATNAQGTEAEVAAAAAVATDGVEFPSDLAAPADYRAHLTRVLTARALRRAIQRATEGAP
jgi:aerobic carbon-monoxide dehydrogenase medium subunit